MKFSLMFISILINFNVFALDKNNSALNPCYDGSVLTVNSSFEEIENIFSSALMRDRQNELCREHEEEFRQHILQRLGSFKGHWSSLVGCLNEDHETSENIRCRGIKSSDRLFLNALDVYRPAIQRVYQGLANSWLQSQEGAQKEFSLNCFVSRDQHQQENFQVNFNGHVRMLASQNDLPQNQCVGPHHLWELYRNEHLQLALENPTQYGITQDDISTVNEFNNSFFGSSLEDHVKHGIFENDEELTSVLHHNIQSVSQNLEQLYDGIQNLSRDRLYELYDYQNLYEENFLSHLSARERNLFHPICRNQSTWGGSCFSSRLVAETGVIQLMALPGDLNRCGARSIDILRENLPLVGSLDAILADDTHFEELAHLHTASEAEQERLNTSLQFLFGLPVTGLFGAAATTPLRVGSAAAARQVVEEAGETTLTFSLRTRMNSFLVDETGALPLSMETVRNMRGSLVRRVRSCLPADCRLREVIIRPADLAHILPHSFTPTGARNFILERRERIAEIINSGGSFSDIQNRLIRFLENGGEAPFRSQRITSLSPQNNSLVQVLQDLPNLEMRRVNDQIENGAQAFSIRHTDRAGNINNYRIQVCVDPTCRRRDGGELFEITEENRMLTMHACGRNAFQAASAEDLTRSLIRAYQANENPNLEAIVDGAISQNTCH